MDRNLNICFLRKRWKRWKSNHAIRLKVGQRNKDVVIAQELTDSYRIHQNDRVPTEI